MEKKQSQNQHLLLIHSSYARGFEEALRLLEEYEVRRNKRKSSTLRLN